MSKDTCKERGCKKGWRKLEPPNFYPCEMSLQNKVLAAQLFASLQTCDYIFLVKDNSIKYLSIFWAPPVFQTKLSMCGDADSSGKSPCMVFGKNTLEWKSLNLVLSFAIYSCITLKKLIDVSESWIHLLNESTMYSAVWSSTTVCSREFAPDHSYWSVHSSYGDNLLLEQSRSPALSLHLLGCLAEIRMDGFAVWLWICKVNIKTETRL